MYQNRKKKSDHFFKAREVGHLGIKRIRRYNNIHNTKKTKSGRPVAMISGKSEILRACRSELVDSSS